MASRRRCSAAGTQRDPVEEKPRLSDKAVDFGGDAASKIQCVTLLWGGECQHSLYTIVHCSPQQDARDPTTKE